MRDRTADHRLLLEAVGLKDLDRAGWLRAGIDRPESVAAHTFGVALAALLFCPEGVDREKLLVMAILHDLAEVRVGDLTPYDGVPREEKRKRERRAMASLLAHRPDLLAIWEEAEAGTSPEALLLHHLDKLDMGVTAEVYAARGHDTSEFLASARAALAALLGRG